MATLLLVDDHPGHRLALECTLEPLGHSLLVVGSGEEALELLRVVRVDLVITDLWMKGMSGAELATAVFARSTGIPVVLLSGADADDREVGLAKQVPTVAFVQKPYAGRALRELVAKLLGQMTHATLPRSRETTDLASGTFCAQDGSAIRARRAR